jgi:hypothetical protein
MLAIIGYIGYVGCVVAGWCGGVVVWWCGGVVGVGGLFLCGGVVEWWGKGYPTRSTAKEGRRIY